MYVARRIIIHSFIVIQSFGFRCVDIKRITNTKLKYDVVDYKVGLLLNSNSLSCPALSNW